MNDKVKTILFEARRFHRNCKDYRIYEAYKKKILALNLDGLEFIEAMKELTTILRV